MSLADLKRNAGILPISETGLRTLIEVLDEHRDLSVEDFVDACRYPIRILAACLPADRFELHELARMVEVDEDVEVTWFYSAVEGTGDFDDEVGASAIRALLGLIDDGVRPSIAARHLNISEDELDVIDHFVGLERHWATRIFDRLQVLVHDGASLREIRRTFNVSRLAARRLRRAASRSLYPRR